MKTTMNKLNTLVVLYFAASFIFPFAIRAQNNVGIGTNTPNQSSVLEMQATDKIGRAHV